MAAVLTLELAMVSLCTGGSVLTVGICVVNATQVGICVVNATQVGICVVNATQVGICVVNATQSKSMGTDNLKLQLPHVEGTVRSEEWLQAELY
ncbi:hypothetical protein J6590_014701 [Homalodisca vitripennis]|nr:hypothetical protein J6590_014701 [Homalodisca vitripennis]